MRLGVVAVLAVGGGLAQVALCRLEAFLHALTALDQWALRLVRLEAFLAVVLGRAAADAAGLGGCGVLLLPHQRVLGRLFVRRHAPPCTRRSAGRIAQRQIRAVHEELEATRPVAPLERLAELLGDAHRLVVRGLDEADDVPELELVMRPLARRATRLGCVALAPVAACDSPADLDA